MSNTKAKGKAGRQSVKASKKQDALGLAVVSSLKEVNDLPKEINDLIENENLKELDAGKTETLLRLLKRYMVDTTARVLEGKEDGDEAAATTSALYACVGAVKWVVDFTGIQELKRLYSVPRISTMFASLLVADKLAFKLRNQMCAVCEKLISLGIDDDEDAQTGILVLVFLLNLTLGKTGLKSDVKRVWSVNSVIRRLDFFQPVLATLLEKLMNTVTEKRYLEVKEGRQHIGHLLGMDPKLVKPAYERILAKLPKMSKDMGTHYGEILVIAWNHSIQDARKEIEEICIQDLMRRIFTLKRNGLNFEKAGQLVFDILKCFHNSRWNQSFSSAVTTLYTPLIWRSLRSGHPLERCNAAQVFMHVFPLEKSDCGFTEDVQYKEKQFKEVLDLLEDDYHIVRIITIKGVCYHLTELLESFTIVEVKTLLKTLADNLANDGSNYMVRLAVFEGFAEMVKKKESAQLLESILPQMKHHVHDENEKVRCAFVKILQNVNDFPESMSINYWDIVPIDHLAARLELEGFLVGELLVKLVINNFYVPGEPLNKVVSRVIRLVKMNPKAARRLFQFSAKILTVKDIHAIIIALLAYLRQKAKETLEEVHKENDENVARQASDSPVNRRKRKKSKEVLADIVNLHIDNNDKSNDSRNEEVSEIESGSATNGEGSNGNEVNDNADPSAPPPEEITDELVICRGVLEAACTAWLVFSEQLNLLENEQYLADLYTLAVATIPLFLRCYKGTDMYYATVYFASLVPINKLSPVSTVSGACLSELREVTSTTPLNQVKCLMYSLCAWNRGQQVIDLVMEWINQAFKQQELNTTAMPKEGQRRRKVRFQSSPGKPLLGLKLLNILFDDVINEKRLLAKSYDQVYDLFVYLERIKILLERRMESDAPLPEIELSDVFLTQLLKRYLQLGHILHCPDKVPQSINMCSDSGEFLQPVSAPEFFCTIIDWAGSILKNKLPSELVDPKVEKPVAVLCLMEILINATHVVELNMTNILHCQVLAAFTIQLLSTGCGIWFVEQALVIVQSLVSHAEAYTVKDDWGLLRVIIPSLYSKCLDTFVQTKLVSDNLQHCITGKGSKVRNGLQSYLVTVNRISGKKSKHLVDIIEMLMNCCVHMALRKIEEEKEIQSLDQLKDQPFMVELIMKFLLTNSSYCAHILPTFVTLFNKYSQDGLWLGSCISLLNTVVRTSNKKFKRVNLEKVMQIAFQTLDEFKKTSSHHTRVNDSMDSSFCSEEMLIDVVLYSERILSDLGKVSCCALRPLSGPPVVTSCSTFEQLQLE